MRACGSGLKVISEVLLILLWSVIPSWAALGELESSVSADANVLQGQVQEQLRTGYTLHEITLTRGARLREYVSPAGRVFGVSWQGPFTPNMQQVLGAHFSDLQQYAQSQTRRRGGPLVIENRDFVFFHSGHMGWSSGRAYVPSLVPANLSPEVVR